MTSLTSSTSTTHTRHSPLMRTLESMVKSGEISSSDESTLSSALSTIDDSLKSDAASSAGSTPPSPEDMQKKVSDLAQAFSSAFNMGGPSMFDKMGPNPGRRAEMPSDQDLGNSAYIQENQSLEQAKKEMDEYIDQNQLTDQLSTELTEDGLLIRIKEKALFPSGSAELGGQAQNIGPVVAGLLASIPERVVISAIRTMYRSTVRSFRQIGS